MKKFIPQFRGEPWPEATRVLQVYGLPDLARHPALQTLVDGCHTVMKDWPLLPAPLHITLEMITDARASEISDGERKDLTNSLQKHLADATPWTGLAGPPIANKAGALLDLHPDPVLEDLHRRIRAAVHAARGPMSTQYDVLPAHLSIGYAHSKADSDTLQSALRRIRPSHVALTIDAVDLVEVHFDQLPVAEDAHRAAYAINWNSIATIRLGDRHAT
ncbi:2'-5' RNA ligase family protein [Streptomyces hygroscopicus]|uniref:2'-5' RNA ligase family protein n=1 Tax=Streptomyces hygroscopicus TaxID=1912 RepID=UPI0007677D56|nr:2'-5' RNA ligase family protein [Streptomyces hygroscopicus]